MANKKNKVKFGLQNVYWAKINEWGEDPPRCCQSICPVLYRFLLTQTAKQRISLRTMVFIMSSTTMQDIQVTLKSPL